MHQETLNFEAFIGQSADYLMDHIYCVHIHEFLDKDHTTNVRVSMSVLLAFYHKRSVAVCRK